MPIDIMGTLALLILIALAITAVQDVPYRQRLQFIFWVAVSMMVITAVAILLKVYQIPPIKFFAVLLFSGGAIWLVVNVYTIIRIRSRIRIAHKKKGYDFFSRPPKTPWFR